MGENMALLSQEEIDTLLEFLIQQKSKVGMEVMDQDSIDRLISLLHSNAVREIKYDTLIPEAKGMDTTAILVLDEDGIEGQQQNCVLECEVDEQSGYLKIFCCNRKNGKKYAVTPKCLEQVRYIKDDTSEWGFAIPPLTFDQIAALTKIKYTKKTLDQVCRIYSSKIFGNADKKVPNLYMPSVYNLIHHLTE